MKIKFYAYLLFILIIFPGCLTGQGQRGCRQTFMISVDSTPDGAEVYLNKDFLGITPLRKSSIRVTYDIATAGLFFASTGWSVMYVNQYYLFVKKNGYKTVMAKLGIVYAGSKLRLKNNQYNFELKKIDTADEAQPRQLEIKRILTPNYSGNQEFEMVKNIITDFGRKYFPNPEYFRISKEKVSVTKNSFEKVRVFSSLYSHSPQSVGLDFCYKSPFFDSEIAKIDSGEKIKGVYPTFGLFIDGELLSTATALFKDDKVSGTTLAFDYPWEWDDGRLLAILDKLGLKVYKGNTNEIIVPSALK